jgi:prophage regulatory protein
MDIKDSRQTELPLEQTKPAVHPKPPRILRLAQVRELTGLGRSCIYQLQAENLFPRRIKLGARAVGWIEAEVHQWVEAKITQSRAKNHATDGSQGN